MSGPAALTHLSGRQPFDEPFEHTGWPHPTQQADESSHHTTNSEQADGEVELGFLAEVSPDREFWSDSEEDDEAENEEPWDDLSSHRRRRHRRVPMGLAAGATVGGVALLIGIWSMASTGNGPPAESAATSPSSSVQSILDSPPPPPEGEPTEPIRTLKPSRKPVVSPTTKAPKPLETKTARPTHKLTTRPSVRRSPTARPTKLKDTVEPAGPTEAPPPPTGEQDDEPPQTGPTEIPPPPGG
ncbi:hypothetical protein GCM10020219_101550 [Nonomuraea dietziae]